MTELEQLRARMTTPTSKSDLEFMLGGAIKILTYQQIITDYEDINSLLEPYNAIIILYPNPNFPDVGHWCTLFVQPGGDRLIFYDSYGAFIDEKIGEMNEKDDKLKRQKTRIEPKLVKMILESDWADKFYWDDTTMQSEVLSDISTCGLYCVLRLLHSNMREEEFKRTFFTLPVAKDILPDMLVCDIITTKYPEMKIK